MRNFRERLLKSLPLEVGVPYRSAVWGISNVLFLQFRFAGEPCCEGGFGWLGDGGIFAANNGLSE